MLSAIHLTLKQEGKNLYDIEKDVYFLIEVNIMEIIMFFQTKDEFKMQKEKFDLFTKKLKETLTRHT